MLVDAPVHVGKVDTINFKAGKVQFHVALQGIGNYSDKKLSSDLAKIADTTYAIFGGEEGVPFTDYTYILHLRPGGRSGLEHRNSTAIGLEPWIFGDPAAYRNSSAPRPTSSSTRGTSSASAPACSARSPTSARSTPACCGSRRASPATTRG
ncbi:hypothetical protein [Nannocystis pusilla]|uniref:hypothetical protein n=1 Tax=Nannocystis pusilla TaxID=889268 RepID=UPI003B806751